MKSKNENKWIQPEIVKGCLSGVRTGFPGTEQQIHILLQLLRNNFIQIKNFLDIGCGDGFLGSVILKAYNDVYGFFVDFSSEMLKAERAKLSKYNNRIQLLKTDINNRKWIEEIVQYSPFNAIVSGLAIHHLENERKLELYSEIFNLLSNNGIFINIEHVKPATESVGKNHGEFFIESAFEHFS